MKFPFLCLGFLMVLLISSFIFPSAYASTVEEVYTNAFDARRVAWVEVGSSPYLHDTTVDYIYVATNSLEEGDWSFSASAGSGTINSVKLRFENKISVKYAGSVETYVWDGSEWVFVGEFGGISTTYVWEEIDVSWVLDTWAKINGAEVYLNYVKYATGTQYVRRLTRKVDYTVAAAEYNFYGSAPLTFTTNAFKTVSFNRYGTSTLTFTLAGTFLKSQFLNFFGSALLTFTSAMSKALGFNRYGTSILTFSTAYEKLVSLTRFGTSAFTFLVESFQNIISAKTLNLFGSANLNFLTEMLKTFSLTRYGTASLTFTIESLVQGLGRFLTFFGSAVFTFTIIGQTVGLEIMDLISLALCILALAFSVYPLVE